MARKQNKSSNVKIEKFRNEMKNGTYGNGQITYKNLLDREMMPVTFHHKYIEENTEVMWLADRQEDKWIEDYVVIRRDEYEISIDENGAVYAYLDGIKKLVKAPNIKHFRIPEDVDDISEHALRDCPNLKVLDVPYTIDDYHLDRAMEFRNKDTKVMVWNWCYDQTFSEELRKEIKNGKKDEYGFIYSKDGKRLLRATKVDEYWIPEGVEKIERLAFVGCPFETLHVPYTCKLSDLPKEEYPVFGNERVAGCIMEWARPYSQEQEEDNPLCSHDDNVVLDKYGVAYSRDKKRLMWAGPNFCESEYCVPDGAETICSMAFNCCPHFVTLIIPRSVSLIGDFVFGPEGGKIKIRKK